jgi:hypothetical protein
VLHGIIYFNDETQLVWATAVRKTPHIGFAAGVVLVGSALSLWWGIEDFFQQYYVRGASIAGFSFVTIIAIVAQIQRETRGRSRWSTESFARFYMLAATALAIWLFFGPLKAAWNTKESVKTLAAFALLVAIPLGPYLLFHFFAYGLSQFLKTPREHLDDLFPRDRG